MARKSCQILTLFIIVLIPVMQALAQLNTPISEPVEISKKTADSKVKPVGAIRIAPAATCPAPFNRLNGSKRSLSEIAFNRIPGITPSPATPQLSSQQKPLGLTYGPFWQVGGGYSSTLIIKNRDRQNSVIATVVLLSPDGKEEQKTLLEVPANSAGRVRLSDIVKTEGDAIHSGGLKLLFNTPNPKTISQVVIENYKTGIIFDLEVLGGYRYDTENALHTSWWLPDEGTDGIVTLFNSSTERIVVSPSVVVDAAEHAADAVSLVPSEMKRLRLRDLLPEHDFKSPGSGSVILRYTGPSHALYPSLLLSNPKTGFSLVPAFNAKHDLQAKKKTEWQFPSVFLSSNPALGFNQSEKLTAYVLLTNGTKNAIAAELTAHGSGAAENVQDLALPAKPLAPLETRIINLSEELLNLGISSDISHITLGVGHNGNPGDLGIAVFSVGQSKDFVFRSEGAVHPARAVDSSYWDIGGDLVSVLAVFNSSAKNTTARATLSFDTQNGTGTYLLPLFNLAAKGSKVLNLKEAILAGTPDQNGNVIPSGTTFGTLLLEVTDKSSQEFILGGTTTFDPVKGGYGLFIDPGCGDFCSTCEDCEDLGSGFECVPSCDNSICCPPPLPQPHIDSISPTQVPIGTTSVSVTLKGTFNTNPRVFVSGSGITAGSAGFDQNNNLVTTFTISSSAVVGGYLVIEEDDGGQSNSMTFGLAPRIDKLSQAQGPVATSTTVAITGQGFGTNPTINAGPNITVSIKSKSDTQIVAAFALTSSSSAAGNQNVTATVNNVSSSPSVFFGQVPTFFGPLSADSGVDGGCRTGAGGTFFTIHYQVLDQIGNALKAVVEPQEHVAQNGVSQPPPFWNDFSTPTPTLNDGLFLDDPIGTCFVNSNPPPIKPLGNPCISNLTQQFQAIMGGQTYPIQTNTTRTDCSNGSTITVGGNPGAFNKTFSQGNTTPQ